MFQFAVSLVSEKIAIVVIIGRFYIVLLPALEQIVLMWHVILNE